jgi:hypothetical protein
MAATSQGQTVSTTFRSDLLSLDQSLIQILREIKTLPVMWRGRAVLIGAGILFVSIGLAVGWILQPRWKAAALVGPAVAASSIWALDNWALGTLSLGAIAYLLATGMAALGVGLAAWDWSRMRRLVSPGFARRADALPVLESGQASWHKGNKGEM